MSMEAISRMHGNLATVALLGHLPDYYTSMNIQRFVCLHFDAPVIQNEFTLL
jgi:hypothetical protein